MRDAILGCATCVCHPRTESMVLFAGHPSEAPARASDPVAAAHRCCGESQQAAAVAALECCHCDNYALIPQELQSLKEDCTTERKVACAPGNCARGVERYVSALPKP